MRVLLVEDDERTVGRLRQELGSRIPNLRLEVAECLDQVLPILKRSTIDAAVVDLRIPSSLGRGDASVEFGKAAEVRIREQQPGALRVFYTASEASEVVKALAGGRSEDFFLCQNEFPLADWVIKDGIERLRECVDKIVAHQERLAGLDEIDLSGVEDFDEDERRAIALTVRAAGGYSGRVLRTTGKSGARTALVECRNESGSLVSNAFCKSGEAGLINREIDGYERAAFQLPSTALPKLEKTLDVGVGKGKALVMTKAPSNRGFFDLIALKPETAVTVVKGLRSILEPWKVSAERKTHTITTLIDSVLSAETRKAHSGPLSALDLTLDLPEEVDLVEYCQHGDLHGENIFVLPNGEPFLIDFAHTRIQPGPVDPVSLELSLIFHDVSPFYDSVTLEDCRSWFADSHYSPLVQVCRKWAFDFGHTEADYALTSLLYALWILKHTDHPDRAFAIAQGSLAVLRGHESLVE